jgi:Zn-finger nucleic acid-binding protein
MSCAPFLIALSSSGKRKESVSRESSVHSMISISSPLRKFIKSEPVPERRVPGVQGEHGARPGREHAAARVPRCDGVWVDAGIFEALCADREAQARCCTTSPRAAVPVNEAVRYRPCVSCGVMMNRLNFGRLSGTIVDVCRGHGTFLDAGELHAILTFIQAGGLDRARAREVQELKDERRRLERARIRTTAPGGRAAAEFTRPARSAWDASVGAGPACPDQSALSIYPCAGSKSSATPLMQ